jgi:hypothetical protein
MGPVIIAISAVVAAIVGFVIGALVTRSRVRQELERLAAEQTRSVQLYLRRKVAETGVDIGDPALGTEPQDVLDANARMAEALLAHERKAIELGDTQELGLARTVRLKSETGEIPPLPTEDS